MIHFLDKREDESKKETEALKELLSSLRADYKAAIEQTQRLLKTIETLTQQLSEITVENKKLQQTIDELLKQASTRGYCNEK